MINSCFIRLFCQIFIKSKQYMIKLLYFIGLIYHILFKKSKLWNTLLIKILQVIILSKPLEMPPNSLTIFPIQILFIHPIIYSVYLFSKYFHFAVKILLDFGNKIHSRIGIGIILINFIIQNFDSVTDDFLSRP